MEEKVIWGIRLIRALSATVEVTAVFLLMRMNNSVAMLRLNGLLGMVGPIIFIAVSALGLAGSLGKVEPGKVAIIFLGVALVVWGTR